jgi:hypothetical protein
VGSRDDSPQRVGYITSLGSTLSPAGCRRTERLLPAPRHYDCLIASRRGFPAERLVLLAVWCACFVTACIHTPPPPKWGQEGKTETSSQHPGTSPDEKHEASVSPTREKTGVPLPYGQTLFFFFFFSRGEDRVGTITPRPEPHPESVQSLW